MADRKKKPQSLVDQVYDELKRKIHDFELLPGDRFTESQIASQLSISRTPVREALSRLAFEGYVEGYFRNGWQIRDFDFLVYEELYDLRIILETAAVKRLCASDTENLIQGMRGEWFVPVPEREADVEIMCGKDESFHRRLVDGAGNREMSRVHRSISERIHLIRRLDFTVSERISATYSEHQDILDAVLARNADEAVEILTSHILQSKNEIRHISFHKLYSARKRRSTV